MGWQTVGSKLLSTASKPIPKASIEELIMVTALRGRWMSARKLSVSLGKPKSSVLLRLQRLAADGRVQVLEVRGEKRTKGGAIQATVFKVYTAC